MEYQGPRKPFSCPNLKSAIDNPTVIEEKINKELECDRVEGPFKTKAFPNIRISPLSLVPKISKGSWRLIFHLSYPHKKPNSINAGISDESSAVHSAGIYEAIPHIKILDIYTFLCKTDFRSAFRILPVNPNDFELLGISGVETSSMANVYPLAIAQVAKYLRSLVQPLNG